jgi:hypothetical protein
VAAPRTAKIAAVNPIDRVSLRRILILLTVGALHKPPLASTRPAASMDSDFPAAAPAFLSLLHAARAV